LFKKAFPVLYNKTALDHPMLPDLRGTGLPSVPQCDEWDSE
jgi:hypothetical protein